MKIDLKNWNDARRAVEVTIRRHKNKIRHEVEGKATRDDWFLLRDLKDTATRLYAIRASASGREHGNVGPYPAAEFTLKIEAVQ